jgi:hypothetical protein
LGKKSGRIIGIFDSRGFSVARCVLTVGNIPSCFLFCAEPTVEIPSVWTGHPPESTSVVKMVHDGTAEMPENEPDHCLKNGFGSLHHEASLH